MGDKSRDRDWKLRILVDRELLPGQQIAQALHAIMEYSQEHPESTRHWHDLSNSVICMSASKEDIMKTLEKATRKGILFSVFHEPDMDNRLTAVALEPNAESRRLTGSFPLALK